VIASMSVIRFVGRHRELSLLAGLVEALRAGVGGVVVVAGEQGIGKTALLRAGLGGADGMGGQVLWASADEPGRLFPLQLMLECVGPQGLAAVGDEGPAGPVFGADPVLAEAERLLAAVDRLCTDSPVVLVAEDLQWADDASVLVWDRLSQATGQMPLLLVGSWRPGAGGRTDLGQVEQAVLARGGSALRLGPLPAGDVTALVADRVGGRPGWRLTDLVARAGGNPLYTTELADGLVRDGLVRVAGGVAEVAGGRAARIPASLTAAIRARLAVLAPGEVDVLRQAAVLGTEFSVHDLELVTGLPSGDLQEAVDAAAAAGVVARADARLGFRHGLIRQVLYEGMPESRRWALHAQAAHALSGAGAPPERVATQLVLGQAMAVRPLLPWLADWLADNAGTLMHRAPQAAAALLRAAVEDMPVPDSRRDALEAALVSVSFLLARHEDVERFGTALMTRSADADRVAEMGWLVGYTLLRTGRRPEAGTVVAGISASPGLGDGQRARLTALQAMISSSLGDTGQAAASGEAALALAAKAGDAIGVGYALHALSTVANTQRDQVAAVGLMDRALAVIGDDPQATDLRALLLTNKALALRELDQPGPAMAAAREALALAEHVGTHRVGTARFAVAAQHDLNGEWDDALAELEVAARLPLQHFMPAVVHGLIALIAGHRDDPDAMAAHLGAVADLKVSPGDVQHEWFSWRARALAAEQAGNLAAAAAVLAVCLEPGIAEQMPTGYQLLPELARLAVMAGDRELAAQAAQAARAEANAEPIAVKVAMANHCEGLVAGDPEAVARAADYFRSTGRALDQAIAEEDVAVLQAERGDTAAARTALRAALAVYHRLGATWDARRAEARLSAVGVRVPHPRHWARPATGWDALTPTELRVAHLVAEGRSNPDIAAELFLSRNTVQTHVSHILVKLQARSRAGIVREALRAAWRPMTTETGPHPQLKTPLQYRQRRRRLGLGLAQQD
jgi:DNA-binding CsgD family transcriptional regulator